MITLSSSEGTQVQVEREVAEKSVLIKNMIEDLGEVDTAIPLMNVSGPILHKVIDWCRHHKDDPVAADSEENSSAARLGSFEISQWDEEFFKVDQGTLFELILVINVAGPSLQAAMHQV